MFNNPEKRRTNDKGAEIEWLQGMSPEPFTLEGEATAGIRLETDQDIKKQIQQLRAEQEKIADAASAASLASNKDEHQRLLAEIRKCDTKIAELEKRLSEGDHTIQ